MSIVRERGEQQEAASPHRGARELLIAGTAGGDLRRPPRSADAFQPAPIGPAAGLQRNCRPMAEQVTAALAGGRLPGGAKPTRANRRTDFRSVREAGAGAWPLDILSGNRDELKTHPRAIRALVAQLSVGRGPSWREPFVNVLSGPRRLADGQADSHLTRVGARSEPAERSPRTHPSPPDAWHPRQD